MNKINKTLLGFWLYIISDCIMFSVLFISIINSNFFFKNLIFNKKIVLIETIILLICSFLSLKVIRNFKKKYYFLNILFSLIFLTMEFKDIYHLNKINLNFKLNNFLSNYYFILIFHAFHVILSIFICINLILLSYFNKKFKINNIIFSLFWHFIHIIWLCIVIIIYIK